MITIEISSYPKSGNTWFRNLVFQLLQDINATNASLSKDIHGQEVEIIKDIKNNAGTVVDGITQPLYFYKSHIINNPAVSPDKVIYIYRHPLDVLLSTVNWFHIKYKIHPEQFSQNRLDQLFLNGQPKSCETIKAEGELDYYLDKFTKNLGENFHPGMYGKKGSYFTQVISAIKSKNVTPVKYEDLFNNTSSIVAQTLGNALNIDLGDVKIATDIVDSKTKNSGKDFYWKAKSGTRHDFLTEEQVMRFEKKFSRKLKRIGYL